MFDNDVSMTYNHQDATLEILVMLAGAFILGAILSWLLTKLQKQKTRKYSSDFVTNSSNSAVNKNIQANMSSKARVISNNNETAYTTPKFDDLTKISGIDSNIQYILKEQGINSYTDLRDIKKDELQLLQNASIKKDTILNKKITETWPHQANLAAKGEWKKLDEYQQFIHDLNNEKTNNEPAGSNKSDDLKLIEGIGPKIEKILHAQGIDSFQKLSEVDSPTLKKYITDADSRFEKNETESWPHQAAMAEKGQWEELNIYQEFMHSDVEPIKKDEDESTSENKDSGIEKTTPIDSDQDDLKKIEGIGPKIEKLLNKSGIYTFSQLSKSNRDRLKSILMNAGSQFKMHEPESWPHQAGLAHNGEWEKLKTFQEELNSSSKSLSNDEQSTARDDLKKIEGIGPKLQELLNGLEIYTYSDLSKADSNDIQKVLDESGPQYRVHDPKTWPEQAKLAAENKWDELELLKKEIVLKKSVE